MTVEAQTLERAQITAPSTESTTGKASPPLRPPVEGPSAWRGAKLRQHPEEWTYRLSPEEIAEIDAAAEAVMSRGMAMAAVTKADFPLPKFGAKLDELRREILQGRGFILIRGMPVRGRTVERNAFTFWGIGCHIGTAVSQNIRGHLLGHVRDVGVVAATNFNVRASQSRERQLYHTDGCDVVGLICLQTAKSGGLSSIVSSMTVYNEMSKRHPDLARRLFEPVSFDRRGEIRDGEGPFYTMPIFNDHAGLLSVSFTGRNVGSAARHADAPRNPVEAIDCFTTIAEEPDLRLDMELQAGDMQFLHNHTILHDRTAYEDWEEPAEKRHLLRLWIAAEGARPLSSDFLVRYGTLQIGKRGAIYNKDTVLKTPLEAD